MRKILILALFIASCTAERQLAKISVKRPALLAKTCGIFFPVKESTTRETIYVQGQRDTLWQSEYVDCDTIIGKDRIVRVPYVIRIHDTLKVVEVRTEENTAKITALANELSQKQGQLLSTKQTLKNTRGFCGVLIAILALCGLLLYVKFKFT